MAQGLPIGEPVNLQQIGGVDFVLGQQLAATSLPIVLTANQLSTLTPLTSVTVNTISGFALETGGNLAQIKSNTDPFLVSTAGGYIRQDSTATIAKETGGNLASVKTNTDNIDVLLSTRLKPADTLTKVTTVDTITNAVKTNADASVGAGTAPSKSLIVGGQYNTPRITLTNGQVSALQLDADGSQYINVVDWTVNSATVLGHVITDQGSKTQIVDGSGNAVTVTGNKLDVNATITATVGSDKWQTACDAGKGYVTTTNVITVAGSAEVAYFLMKNPLGSGKTVRLHFLDASLDEATGTPRSIIKLYRDPTITANGTALSIYNLLKSGSASVITSFRQPTISANGTLLYTAMYARDATPIDFNLGLSIQPNENLLVTVEPNSTNLGHIHTILWIEE